MSLTSIAATLTDAGIKADVSSLAADGVLSHGDVVKILSDVASRGPVTAAELSSLQTVVANLDVGGTTSAYVASAFVQLVDGSAANAHWNGGMAAAIPLGNFQIGTTGTQLDALIGKWFLGTDLPDPTLSGSQTALSYQSFVTPLYGPTGAPSVNDIKQGATGDCVLLAVMIDMVTHHPDQLDSMIVDDGHGVYGVRFYVNGAEMWQTVNSQLPVTTGGWLAYNDVYATNAASGHALWADLVEKAYAQLGATGLIGHPAVNSYNNIANDASAVVLANITNCTAVQTFSSSDNNWNSHKPLIIAALANGNNVILESWGHTVDSAGRTELVDAHAFAVIGYDSGTDDFIVRNPWGYYGLGQSFATQFEVSMADIAGVYGNIVIDNSVSSTANIAQSGVNTAVQRISGGAGNDTLSGGAGNDTLDGGGGTNTAAYLGKLANYTVTKTGNAYTVTDNVGSDGTDTLTNIERLQFFDAKLAIDMGVTQSGGETALLIGAVLGKSSLSDKAVAGQLLPFFDAGHTMHDAAVALVGAGVLDRLAGGAGTNAYVNLIYQAVAGQVATPGITAQLADYIDHQGYTKADFLAIVADLPLNQANVGLVGLNQTGIEFV